MNVSQPTRAFAQTAANEIPAVLPHQIGRYRVQRFIGKGSFGLLYLAHDDQLQRPVAIKVPHARFVAQATIAESYLTEARIVASLDHPNIVPVYDMGSTEQFPCFIVSKYIDGTDLAARLKQSGLWLHETVELVAAVADALHHAHKQGLVHRDIKPGNILLDKSGKPFVGDFGLALREQDFGKGMVYAGTPAYMSPEQARGSGRRLDGRSDIFSLGVVFYELLTGRRPFEAESQVDLLEQIANLEVRRTRQIDDRIPSQLERICLKALAKRASDRYTTARDMAEDLKNFPIDPEGATTALRRSASDGLAIKGTLSTLTGSSDRRATIERSTFLFVDFKGFTERVRILEQTAGHKAAAEMKRTVAQYINDAFRHLEAEIKAADFQLIDTAGDGFFFHFRRASDVFRVVEKLQTMTAERNAGVADEIAQHWFRAGAATGDVAWDDGKPVGHVVNVGSRLQSASTGGDFVVDQATLGDLPPEMQQSFGPKEIVRDKHDKPYEVYRTAFGRSWAQAGDRARVAIAPGPLPASDATAGRKRRVPAVLQWWVLGGLTLILVVTAIVVATRVPGPPAPGVPPAEETKPAPNPVAEHLRVKWLAVKQFVKMGEIDILRGVVGRDSYAPQLGDRVQIVAELTQPAYAYIVAFRPDGVADLCFPDDEDTVPPLIQNPRYPLEDMSKAYGLREGTGLWIFAVVASEKPLPTYREWLGNRKPPWKSEAIPRGLVWWHDGEVVDEFREGRFSLSRGKNEQLTGPAQTMQSLGRWLEQSPDQAIGMLAFGVEKSIVPGTPN